MRKFKILKDTPVSRIGDTFEAIINAQHYVSSKGEVYNKDVVENNPEWFEEIIEPKFQTDFSKLKDVSGYWITESSNVSKFLEDDFDRMERQVNKLMFSLESLAKSCLALAQLSQFSKEWNSLVESNGEDFYSITYDEDGLRVGVYYIHDDESSILYKIKFKSQELAELSLQHHKDLWLDYYQKNNEEN